MGLSWHIDQHTRASAFVGSLAPKTRPCGVGSKSDFLAQRATSRRKSQDAPRVCHEATIIVNDASVFFFFSLATVSFALPSCALSSFPTLSHQRITLPSRKVEICTLRASSSRSRECVTACRSGKIIAETGKSQARAGTAPISRHTRSFVTVK